MDSKNAETSDTECARLREALAAAERGEKAAQDALAERVRELDALRSELVAEQAAHAREYSRAEAARRVAREAITERDGARERTESLARENRRLTVLLKRATKQRDDANSWNAALGFVAVMTGLAAASDA